MRVVFKLPNGARIEGRFLHANSFEDVSNYLFCHPATPDEFEITTNFPKRTIYSKTNENGTSVMLRPTHVATKTAQSLRIFVNNELNEINYGMVLANDYRTPLLLCGMITVRKEPAGSESERSYCSFWLRSKDGFEGVLDLVAFALLSSKFRNLHVELTDEPNTITSRKIQL
uniref:UBX domain-containing protein n=1 Tax=Glossina palpalis gambiensis TaxID=67801 RepID=A0A1B0C332_9MUSC